MTLNQGDRVIITNPEDTCYGVQGTVTKVTKRGYYIFWDDEREFGTTPTFYRTSYDFWWVRKCTKLERALD